MTASGAVKAFSARAEGSAPTETYLNHGASENRDVGDYSRNEKHDGNEQKGICIAFAPARYDSMMNTNKR